MDYTKIAVAVASTTLLALIHIVGTYLIVLVRKHAKSADLGMGIKIAQVAVGATEQMATVYGISGPQKAMLALSQARTLAVKLGITFTDQQWQSLIEQAVAEVNRLGTVLSAGTGITLAPIAPPAPATFVGEMPTSHNHPLNPAPLPGPVTVPPGIIAPPQGA